MRWAIVTRIAGKEILTTLRDRRAILSNLLLPLILLPLLMLGLPLALGGLFNREQAAATDLAVENLAALPEELERLLTDNRLKPYSSTNARQEVSSGAASVGLIVPPGSTGAAGGKAEFVLVSKRGNLRADVAASKVTGAIDEYSRRLVAARLLEAGLDPAVLEPVSVRQFDASSEAERSSGQLSWLIPFFIAIWTLVGGQMTAIDSTAGEKERGTLESLLVAPVRRGEVVIGKFLATLLFGLSAATMAITGYVAGGSLLRAAVGDRLGSAGADLTAVMGGALQVTPAVVGLLLLNTLFLASVVAALLLAVTMFARSFKEAQSYVAPLSFLLMFPALALQFKDLLDLGDGVYLVPLLNVLLLMDDTVKGAARALPALFTWGSLALIIAMLLAFALSSFRRESVIFRN